AEPFFSAYLNVSTRSVRSGGHFLDLAALEHLGEVQEADHAMFVGNDAFGEGLVEGGRDFRHRLDLARRDGQDVRNAVNQHADDHVVDLGDDDGGTLVGDR